MKFKLLLILSFITEFAFSSYRPILIKQELLSAKFVGEVIFVGYDSILVQALNPFYVVVNRDSVADNELRWRDIDSCWLISRIRYKKVGLNNDTIYSAALMPTLHWMRYNARPVSLPRQVSNGFWPRINDTCLLVLNTESQLSLFALIDQDAYVFWDPYPNNGLNTVFVFDDTFSCYPVSCKNETNHKPMQMVADFHKMKHACQYHCTIRKNELAELLILQE